jgi:hypothetical protein
MNDLGGFGSGNFWPRLCGVGSWCILEMEVDTSESLPTLAIAVIVFNVTQNSCTKELFIVPHPGRQSQKTMDAGHLPNIGNRSFWLEFSVLFESEEWPSTGPKPNHGEVAVKP